jgi:hypothetical protein
MTAEHTAVTATEVQTCTTGPAEGALPAAPLPAAPLVLPPHQNPKRVAIAAMGTSLAQFIQLACGRGGVEEVVDEVWAINATGAVVKHHRLFCMDDLRATIPKEAEEGRLVAQGMLKWLPAHPGPVYTSTAYPEFPGTVEFPLADVLPAIGGLPYLNTTVAFAFAFAMYLKVEEVHLYGCDFTYPDIHVSESGRGCLEFLIGQAAAKGMKIVVPHTTTLLDSNLPEKDRFYGYPHGMYARTVDGKVEVSRTPFPTEEQKA